MLTACDPAQNPTDAERSPEVSLMKGKQAVKKGDGVVALKHFETGLKLSPTHVDLLNGKGVALDIIGNHDAAQVAYMQALAKKPLKSDFIENNLAMSYIMSGEYEAAIEQIKMIKGYKEFAIMRQNLALAYGLNGQMQKARFWGLKDLSETEFKENLEFYREYVNSLIFE
jgi:Flp pilus assembly protein TadD